MEINGEKRVDNVKQKPVEDVRAENEPSLLDSAYCLEGRSVDRKWDNVLL